MIDYKKQNSLLQKEKEKWLWQWIYMTCLISFCMTWLWYARCTIPISFSKNSDTSSCIYKNIQQGILLSKSFTDQSILYHVQLNNSYQTCFITQPMEDEHIDIYNSMLEQKQIVYVLQSKNQLHKCVFPSWLQQESNLYLVSFFSIYVICSTIYCCYCWICEKHLYDEYCLSSSSSSSSLENTHEHV